MKRYLYLFASTLAVAACVTPATFHDQVVQTETQKKRADDLEKQLAALKASYDSLSAQMTDTQSKLTDAQGKLKTAEEQLSVLQLSNKDLQQSMEAKKGELSKKVGELIKEKDDIAQKLADASNQIQDLNKKLADLDAAKKALEAAKETELAQVKKNYEDLTAGLKSEITNGEIKITQLQGKLTVNMVDRILFDSGSAAVKAAGKKVLDRIGAVIAGVKDKDIRIEGHTDNVPISAELQSKYPSNWELSTARATAVARYLQDHDQIDPKRLVATGYGEFRPISANDTPEHRALNRRIEIVLTARD